MMERNDFELWLYKYEKEHGSLMPFRGCLVIILYVRIHTDMLVTRRTVVCVHKCNGMWWNMTTYVCKGQNTSLQHQSKHQSNPQTVSELQWEGLYMYERIARCTCKLIHENMHSNNHTVKESRSPRNCATSRRAFCFHIFARWSRKPEDACLIHSWYEFKVLELLEHSFL